MQQKSSNRFAGLSLLCSLNFLRVMPSSEAILLPDQEEAERRRGCSGRTGCLGNGQWHLPPFEGGGTFPVVFFFNVGEVLPDVSQQAAGLLDDEDMLGMCGGLHICFVLVESELRLLEACGLLSILEGAGEEVRRVLRNKGNKRENLIDAIAVAQSLTCALFVLEQFAAEGSLFLFYFRILPTHAHILGC